MFNHQALSEPAGEEDDNVGAGSTQPLVFFKGGGFIAATFFLVFGGDLEANCFFGEAGAVDLCLLAFTFLVDVESEDETSATIIFPFKFQNVSKYVPQLKFNLDRCFLRVSSLHLEKFPNILPQTQGRI